MKLKVDDVAGAIVLDVEGEVDMETSPKLRDEIKKSVKKKPGAVKLRLADVPYIDSSGIAVLIEGMKWCKGKKIPYSLVDISENVRGVLKLSRLLEAFQLEEGQA